MVAYSFQPMFVSAIRVGLTGSAPFGPFSSPTYHPKMHTIRAHRRGRSRHARPGERLQLYCRQRHPTGFKIGEAICTEVRSITLKFNRKRRSDWVCIGDEMLTRPSQLDVFARSDGFASWQHLRDFWQSTHKVPEFSGVIIYWRRL